MFYSLVHYPQIDRSKINEFRRKHDPYVDLIDAHITIVFPVPEEVGSSQLIDHISTQIAEWKPFKAKIIGLEKAWDHWLFLTLREGRDEVVKLHDKLYEGILNPYLRSDIEFIPHISIGLFTKGKYDLRDPKEVEFDEEAYKNASKEADSLITDQEFLIDKLSLVEINNEFTKTNILKEFNL